MASWRRALDAAGATSIDSTAPEGQRDAAVTLIDEWRLAHNEQLQIVRLDLRARARAYGREELVVDRIKRRESIESKLRRYPKMRLSDMQDIGGCRVVLESVEEVRSFAETFRRSSALFTSLPEKDYIAEPKDSGYRCVHLKGRLRGEPGTATDGRRIEIQVRTDRQHAWATAVETVGTLSGVEMKAGHGNADWLRLFLLMSGEFARQEESPEPRGAIANRLELASELYRLERTLNATSVLEKFRIAMHYRADGVMGDSHYFVLSREFDSPMLTVSAFPRDKFDEARALLAAGEARSQLGKRMDVVLVSAESLDALRRGFPNYFNDAQVFVNAFLTALMHV